MIFTQKLIKKIQETSPIMVGIDPNFDYLPTDFHPKSNALQDVENALFNFAKEIIDATFDLIPGIKPQIAYFEQFGLAGLTALARILEYAKSKDLLIIMDAKRGDIGSTSQAYANSYLIPELKINDDLKIINHFESDSLTVNPFLGIDAIEPLINTAIKNNKGLFVLLKTSNPGSDLIQGIKNSNNQTVSEILAKKIFEINKANLDKNGYGPIGAVVGSTYPEEAKKLRKILKNGYFLIPGTGTQGGTIKTALDSFNPDKTGGIIPISRSITYPDKKEIQEFGFKKAVRNRLQKFINEFKEV
jgi:orotidine-5'-phosphate decarboxylase